MEKLNNEIKNEMGKLKQALQEERETEVKIMDYVTVL